jgi:hypothetical protein
VADALALGPFAGDVGTLLGGELEARPELDATGLGAGAPLRGSRHDQLALELASPASTVTISRPCGVVVSAQASLRDRNSAPFAAIVASTLSRSRVERASVPP